MVEAIAAGAMALGSLVQLYQAEQARGAEKARLKEIENLYNQIKPPDYNLKVMDPPKLHEEKLATPEFSGPQSAPKFNLDKITPEQFKQVGKYIPDVAPYIAEQAPQVLEKTADMKAGRQAQLNALQKFQQVGSGEFDPEYQEAITKASRNAQADAQSRQASILQDFARRGQSGSGLSLAAQIGGSSQAMDREAMANLGAATQAYKNRLSALSQGAQLGGQIGQEDQSFQRNNADIINAFNQRMSSSQQQYQNQRAQQMNQANQYNLGAEQNIANMNTEGANTSARQNQQRLDELAKYGAQFATQERNRGDELAKYNYGQNVQERNYQNQLAMSKYGNQVAERDNQNSLLGKIYNNQIDRAGLKAGVSNQMGKANTQATQDRNAAIQGLMNVGNTYAQNEQARSSNAASNLQKSDADFFKQKGRFMSDDELDQLKNRDYGQD